MTVTPDSSKAIPLILGFDPGRDKCGVAIVGTDGKIYFHEVVVAAEAVAAINALQQQYTIDQLVMGNQTTASQWQQQLEQSLALPLPITLIDERYSTLEARDRYWAMYPPKGLARLIPQGMRDVPRPIDDIVAIILVERYLAQNALSA
jgi:RNase H-fold protein (predicted Holliday junction resolvase)